MPQDRQPGGQCPKCQSEQLVCFYNHFERDALTIDSWEHKCPNCGFRETKAFRSDAPETDAAVDPTACPYCGRKPSSPVGPGA